MRQVAAEAIARARRGDGPTLIEAETYRFRGHSLADPDELRSKEEKDYYLVCSTMRFGALSSTTSSERGALSAAPLVAASLVAGTLGFRAFGHSVWIVAILAG